jgi:hypothetical protein
MWDMGLLRLLAYVWAFPATAVGLAFLPLALVGGGRAQIVDGVVEIHSGLVRVFLRYCTFLKGGAQAMALGHVVLGRDRECLDRTRRHERAHVRQCERWGPLFIPAYLIGAVYAAARGRRAYEDNPFEKQATLVEIHATEFHAHDR